MIGELGQAVLALVTARSDAEARLVRLAWDLTDDSRRHLLQLIYPANAPVPALDVDRRGDRYRLVVTWELPAVACQVPPR